MPGAPRHWPTEKLPQRAGMQLWVSVCCLTTGATRPGSAAAAAAAMRPPLGRRSPSSVCYCGRPGLRLQWRRQRGRGCDAVDLWFSASSRPSRRRCSWALLCIRPRSLQSSRHRHRRQTWAAVCSRPRSSAPLPMPRLPTPKPLLSAPVLVPAPPAPLCRQHRCVAHSSHCSKRCSAAVEGAAVRASAPRRMHGRRRRAWRHPPWLPCPRRPEARSSSGCSAACSAEDEAPCFRARPQV
mmetsp:Transcript_100608/g.323010  ORF Transcript_100608/g.323010 Transcript_100608/m.323010 type:complete len:239 (+) Transcript_100608:240-956(+)